jgi:putative endonuclease
LNFGGEPRRRALDRQGFRILARRWRSPVGEIDIIARRRRLLIIVEVKARDTFDDSAESVTPRQQRRVAAAAEAWLAAHPDDPLSDVRFDVVLVVPAKVPLHLSAAFEAAH